MKKFAIILLLILLPSCATIINHPPAPQEQIDKAQNFEVEKGKARVHFFLGKYNGEKPQLNEAMEIYVNEKKVVTLGNKDEFAAIDLLPGSYAFKCKGLSPGSGMATPVPLEMRVESGELVFLAATFFDKTPGVAYLFGAVGALAGKNFIYTFVKDDNFRQVIGKYKLISLDE